MTTTPHCLEIQVTWPEAEAPRPPPPAGPMKDGLVAVWLHGSVLGEEAPEAVKGLDGFQAGIKLALPDALTPDVASGERIDEPVAVDYDLVEGWIVLKAGNPLPEEAKPDQ